MKSLRLLLPLVSLLVAILASADKDTNARRRDATTPPPAPQVTRNSNPAPSAPPAVAATTSRNNRTFNGNSGAPTRAFTPAPTVNRNTNVTSGSNHNIGGGFSFQTPMPRTGGQNPLPNKGIWGGNHTPDVTTHDRSWQSGTPFIPAKPVYQPSIQKHDDDAPVFRGGNGGPNPAFRDDRRRDIPFVPAQQPVFRGRDDDRFRYEGRSRDDWSRSDRDWDRRDRDWDRDRDWNRECSDWDRAHGWRPLPHNDAWLYLSFGSPRLRVGVPSGLPPLGSVIIGADNNFLGVIDNNSDNPDAIANPDGRFGSPDSPYSLWNPDTRWGARQSPDSPWNPYATRPPMIYYGRSFWGYLTTNPEIGPRVDPNLLMERLGIQPW